MKRCEYHFVWIIIGFARTDIPCQWSLVTVYTSENKTVLKIYIRVRMVVYVVQKENPCHWKFDWNNWVYFANQNILRVQHTELEKYVDELIMESSNNYCQLGYPYLFRLSVWEKIVYERLLESAGVIYWFVLLEKELCSFCALTWFVSEQPSLSPSPSAHVRETKEHPSKEWTSEVGALYGDDDVRNMEMFCMIEFFCDILCVVSLLTRMCA